MAIDAGASAIGLVSKMPSGPGEIEESLIADIARVVPPPVATFLLTAAQDAASIIAQHKFCRTNTIQLVDHVDVAELKKLREGLPGIKLVQVIHVVDEQALDEAVAVEGSVDAILLDSGNPNLATKELGGTGKVHNWDISRQIRESIKVPLFLAGGLRPNNVAEAIHRVAPHGLDLCSGVRTEGLLDPLKLKSFIRSALGERL